MLPKESIAKLIIGDKSPTNNYIRVNHFAVIKTYSFIIYY